MQQTALDRSRGNRGGADGGGTPEEEEMVYVGRDSTRYHRKRDCHYLYNDLKQVGAGEIEDLRNQDGKRYHPCSSCQAASFKGPIFCDALGDALSCYGEVLFYNSLCTDSAIKPGGTSGSLFILRREAISGKTVV